MCQWFAAGLIRTTAVSLLTSILPVARSEQRHKAAAGVAQIERPVGMVLMSLAKCDLLMILAGRRALFEVLILPDRKTKVNQTLSCKFRGMH